MKSDGRDLIFVTATIVDMNGLTVPTAGNVVRFRIKGPASIVAVGNGDPTDHRPFQSDQYDAFHGKCLIILQAIGGNAGEISLTAESDGLAGSSEMLSTQ
jgi:beta-galactosidase